MPDIFLDLRRIDYVSDQSAPVSAWRAHAETLFTTTTNALACFSCIVDTGAPFSVLPFFAATLGILAAVGLLHANGLGDYAVGTDTAYCGLYMQSHQVSFYCQSGH